MFYTKLVGHISVESRSFIFLLEFLYQPNHTSQLVAETAVEILILKITIIFIKRNELALLVHSFTAA